MDDEPELTEWTRTGFGNHADYMFGWRADSLQKAMDANCNLNRDCPNGGIRAQQPAQHDACTKKQQAPEPVDDWLSALPLGEMAIKA